MSALNPALLSVMKRTLRHVRVVSEGEPISGYHRPDPLRENRPHLVVTSWGEVYEACCPFCGDTRVPGRLRVSHAYGTLDDVTGFRMYELWKCFNEECQGDRNNRDELRRMLNPFGSPFVDIPRPAMRPVKSTDLEPVDFPGVLIPLDQLPADNRAVRYLAAGRSPPFDPGALARDWRVAYADHVPPRSRGAMAQGRIVVPVFLAGVQVGWQARFPADLDWKRAGVPKYLHFFPKSRTLYGIDEQAGEPVVVLVEGVTDVWRYGRGAVCGFGKGLSQVQAEMLAGRLAGRPLVLMADQDDPHSEAAFFQAGADVIAAGHAGPVGVAPLPKGTDPADNTTEFLRALAAEAVRAAGG